MPLIRKHLCYAFGVLLCLVAFGANAIADTWTSANGKFQVEAEFVQLKDKKVQLKRDEDKKLIWVELKLLSKKDQRKAARLAKAAMETEPNPVAAKPKNPVEEPKATPKAEPKASPASGMLKSIKLDTELKYDQMSNFGPDGKEEPKNLKVVVLAKGGAAADAFRYGKVKVTEMIGDDGQTLKVVKDKFSMNDISKEMVLIDREDSFFSSHPKDGVGVELELSGKNLPKSIKSLKGQFSLATGGERTTVSVDKLKEKLGKPIVDDALTARGIKIRLDKNLKNEFGNDNGEQLSFSVNGKQSSIIRVFVADADRKELDEQSGSSSGGFGNQMTYGFYFSPKVPENAVLHVELVDNPETLKVPYEFSDLKVPAAK